jgi:hypothetical protein
MTLFPIMVGTNPNPNQDQSQTQISLPYMAGLSIPYFSKPIDDPIQHNANYLAMLTKLPLDNHKFKNVLGRTSLIILSHSTFGSQETTSKMTQLDFYCFNTFSQVWELNGILTNL